MMKNMFVVFIMVSFVFEAQSMFRHNEVDYSARARIMHETWETLTRLSTYASCALGIIPIGNYCYNHLNLIENNDLVTLIKKNGKYYASMLLFNAVTSTVRNSLLRVNYPKNSIIRLVLEHPLALALACYSGYLVTSGDKDSSSVEKNGIMLIGSISLIHLVIEFKDKYKEQIEGPIISPIKGSFRHTAGFTSDEIINPSQKERRERTQFEQRNHRYSLTTLNNTSIQADNEN